MRFLQFNMEALPDLAKEQGVTRAPTFLVYLRVQKTGSFSTWFPDELERKITNFKELAR